MIILSYVATILGLISTHYRAHLKIRGNWLALLVNILWIIYAIVTHQWALAIQAGASLSLAIYAVIHWTKKEMQF